MTAGSEILSYTPNAAVGAGSNADVPVIYSDNNVINQTGRDLMEMNHQNNINIYNQKIKDRDAQRQLIANGKIKTGNILDQDRPVIDGLQKKADDLLLKFSRSNKREDEIAYNNAKGQIEDAVTHAQYRWLGRKQLEAEKANQTLEEDKNAYQRHLDTQDKQDFYSGDYKPFQKSLDYEADLPSQIGWEGVLGQPTTTTNKQTVKTAPNGQQTVTDVKTQVPVKGGKASTGVLTPDSTDVTTATVKRNGKTYQVTQSQIDFDKIRNNEIKAYADDKGKNFQQLKMHRDIYETAPDQVFEPYMNHIVKRVGDYNADKGLKEGDAGYIDTKKLAADLGLDENGKRTGSRINMSTPDFAAYTALADYNGSYAPKSEQFNKEESEFDLKKGLNDANIFYKKALGNAALKKANAYAGHLAAKIKAMKPEEQDNFIGDLYKRNLYEQQGLITGGGGTKVSLAPVSAQKSLPVFTFDGEKPKQLKPIGSTDIVDNAGHVTGYKGGHYNQDYRYNGKTVTPQQLADQYNDFKLAAGSNWKGSFDDYLKEAINNDIYDVKLIGENGSTDKKLTIAAQKAISNKVTKKDQSGVFDEQAPTDEQAQSE